MEAVIVVLSRQEEVRRSRRAAVVAVEEDKANWTLSLHHLMNTLVRPMEPKPRQRPPHSQPKTVIAPVGVEEAVHHHHREEQVVVAVAGATCWMVIWHEQAAILMAET